jgi:hypothetical protein
MPDAVISSVCVRWRVLASLLCERATRRRSGGGAGAAILASVRALDAAKKTVAHTTAVGRDATRHQVPIAARSGSFSVCRTWSAALSVLVGCQLGVVVLSLVDSRAALTSMAVVDDYRVR